MDPLRHDRDLPPGRKHKGLSGQTVRADGRHDDVFIFRLDERAAGRHGVGRGAGRRGDDDAVAVEARDGHAVAISGHTDAVYVPAVNDYIVEHRLCADDPFITHKLHVKHHAPADRIFSVRDLEQNVQLIVLQTGQKSLAAEIHTDDRDWVVTQRDRDVQDRPVAAHDDDERGVLRRLLQWLHRDILRQIGFRRKHRRDDDLMAVLREHPINRQCLLQAAVPIRIGCNDNVFHTLLSFPWASAPCDCSTMAAGSSSGAGCAPLRR